MALRFALLLTLSIACAPRPGGEASQRASEVDTTKPKPMPIDSFLATHADSWMMLPGVTGTGETQKDGKPAILILVDTLTDSLKARLPSEVKGYSVVIQQTGVIRALPAK